MGFFEKGFSMQIGIYDKLVFLVFVISVISVGLIKSRKQKTSEDYFLAGRGLKWWLIGFSLIAANISTEQFVGMNGNAASHVGLAIASYEWFAAITLVFVAFFFLPYFLRAGIYTMPEFLEYRFNVSARTLMAVVTLLIYMLLLGAVTYSGALTIQTMADKAGYNISLLKGSLIIGFIAMVYVFAGGLKACAWADLIQGSALIIGGVVIALFALGKLGTVEQAAAFTDIQTGAVQIKNLAKDSGIFERFFELNKIRLNMYLPKGDPIVPWTALLIAMWIPNFYYWGLNQYITQRTLGSASLAEGQKGIVFAAFMKIIVPFAVVIPGIIAFNLFYNDMQIKGAEDNAKVFVKYQKANPETKLVEIKEAVTDEEITAWGQKKDGKFLVAIFPDASTLKKAAKTPFVLPITKGEFDKITFQPNTVFKSDDKGWTFVFPVLAEELNVYNNIVEEKAKAANAAVSTEKFIAYKYDSALGQLISGVLPQKVGLVGFVLAALLGAVVSSLAAMLNAASTIFTMDVFKRFIKPMAGQTATVLTGRICVLVFAAIAIFLAPNLGNPKISNSIFTIIQESQGFISPGILAAFVFGLLIRKAPKISGIAAILTNIIGYGAIKLAIPQIQFLNRMAVCFALCVLVMSILTIMRPLKEPMEFKVNTNIDLKSSRGAKIAGVVVIILTVALYIIFSPLVVAK